MAKAKAGTRAKSKTTTKRTSEIKTGNSATKKSKPTKDVNLAEVRRNITNIVGEAASEIAVAVVVEAKKGQLATAKYLFEAAGVYPVSTEGNVDKPEEDTFAQRLVRTFGLPAGPLPGGDESDPLEKVMIPAVKSDLPEEKKTIEAGEQKAVGPGCDAVGLSEGPVAVSE